MPTAAERFTRGRRCDAFSPAQTSARRSSVSAEDATALGQVELAFRRQAEATRLAAEELHAELLLQRLDLPADGRLGEEQFRRGLGEAEVARGGVEAFQRIEGGEAVSIHDNYSCNRFTLLVCES